MTPERILAQDLVLVAVLVFAVYAGVLSLLGYRRRRAHGDPAWIALAVLVAAVAAVVAVVIVTWPRFLDLGRASHRALYPAGPRLVLPMFLGAALAAAATADSALSRHGLATRALGVLLQRRRSEARQAAPAAVGIARVLVVTAVAVTSLAAIEWLDVEAPPAAAPPPAAFGTVVAEHPLPEGPLAVAMTGPREGYLSLLEGTIARFALPDRGGEAVTLVVVASGLEGNRGIVVADGYLLVAENLGLPCPDPTDPHCLEDVTPIALELETIATAEGRISRFPVLADGSLGPPEVIVSGLPVTAYDHGVNGLALGPDGRVYVTIGGLNDLSLYPEAAAGIDHPRADLIGTVVSLLPDGSDLRVHARGLRNVYDLAFTPDGRLYAADNDGEALNALRAEELVEIVEGGHYGYPADGSFAPFTTRTHFPLWLLDQVGSAGITWSEPHGAVVTGGLARLHLVELGTRPGAAGPLVGSRGSVRRVVQLTGYATVVEALPDGSLLVGVLNPWEPEHSALLVVTLPPPA